MSYRNLALMILLLFVLGCGGNIKDRDAKKEASIGAVAIIHPLSVSGVEGTVRFTALDEGGVRIQAEIKGLAPGKHGFHIHEFGDCSSSDGSSAGGHFNPSEGRHGGPEEKSSHAGDLGNLDAGSDGLANYGMINRNIGFDGENSIIGRAVIIHEQEDDLKTDPSGGSGKRIACGIIGLSSK